MKLMKNYEITYTLDFCATIEKMTVKAMNYTGAYVLAAIALPSYVNILEAKETELALGA